MDQERVFKVLLGSHIFEKATGPADSKSQFVLKIATDTTKLGTKKAIESLSSVKVQRVTTLDVKGRTECTAHGLGKRNDWGKTYIVLQPGQDLDFATGAE